MKCLGIDPGALRLGYAMVESDGDGYRLLASGITGLEQREDEKFQDFRRRIISHWSNLASFSWLMTGYQFTLGTNPDRIASEIVPAVGSGNFIAATQSELVKVTLACLQTMHEIYLPHIEWKEVASSTVKKDVFGVASKPPKPGSKKRVKVSKVDMRNAVQEVFPQLKERKWEEDLLPDEIDAVAVALCAAGYRRKH